MIATTRAIHGAARLPFSLYRSRVGCWISLHNNLPLCTIARAATLEQQQNPISNDHFHQQRHFSSRSNRDRGSGFQLDALPFSIAPEQALDKFQQWAVEEQGLKYLMRWDSVRIGAAYVPVYSFDVNIRFAVTDDGSKKKRYDWKPSIFASVYPSNQSVMHLQGLGAYAGHSYRRTLVHPLVSTTLVFMGDQTVPFEKFMLRDMMLKSTGDRLQVTPDPWNSTRRQAFVSLVDDLQALAEAELKQQYGNNATVQVQTEIVSSRRVYLPMFIIDYTILGAMEYRAFTSGCDAAAGVSGVNHKIFGNSSNYAAINQASQTFLSQSWRAAQMGLRGLGSRNFMTAVIVLLQMFGNLMARIALRIPVVAFVGGLFVGFRKIVQPWMDNRRASAEWERQREHEAKCKDDGSHQRPFGDDFVDNGSAQQFFVKNRQRILQYLGGRDSSHEQGDFDWYKDWEEWARQQWQQQQQQDQYRQGYYQQQTYARKQQKRPQFDDIDPNDPYSVLGIERGATKSEVSRAFRREMLKWHPDTQAGASDADKRRSVERSKLISEAYRQIKASMKK